MNTKINNLAVLRGIWKRICRECDNVIKGLYCKNCNPA